MNDNLECSLYIHVPFCSGKCAYCDFYSAPVKTGDPRLNNYVETLLRQGERLFEYFKPSSVPTLYVGGGTPSVLGPAGINRLLSGILNILRPYSAPPLEITIEANPESADEAFLEGARKNGATRLSLGLQSFHGPSRRAVKRIGDEGLLSRSLALASDYFPGALSLDLMSGLPFQDEKVLLDDISRALEFSPAHVSLYSLTLESGSPLAEAAGLKSSFDLDGSLWLSGRDALEKSAYGQYEVSNFCLEGKEALHNIRYWRMLSWLALGPAASGTFIPEGGRAFRYTIPPDIDTWLAERELEPLPESLIEELDKDILVKESLMMGFRYIQGPDEDLFKRRFGKSIGEIIPKTLKAWAGSLQKDKMALTKEGLLFLNSFLIDAFREYG